MRNARAGHIVFLPLLFLLAALAPSCSRTTLGRFPYEAAVVDLRDVPATLAPLRGTRWSSPLLPPRYRTVGSGSSALSHSPRPSGMEGSASSPSTSARPAISVHPGIPDEAAGESGD